MKKAQRGDTARNRSRLVAAAAELAATDGEAARMSDLAELADLSLATAYRHFGSVDEALAEYRFNVGMQLYAFSRSSDERGIALLRSVSAHWVMLVMDHGHAMVSTRSREGYLKRLRAGTRYIAVAADAMAEPIKQAAAELGLPDPDDEGMFLWNMMFDPREIFDIVETIGLDPDEAANRLVDAFCGALQGWASHKASSAQQHR